MKKFFNIFKLIFLLLFLYSCGSVGEALQGKKRSDQGDEFLVDKKNPLVMPPDFDKLPKPGEVSVKSTKDLDNEQSNIKNLLNKSSSHKNTLSTEKSTSIESSILKKIK